MEKTEKNNNEIRIINLNSYIKPMIVETSYKEWIQYGETNDYFGYIIERYNNSVTNSAVINGIIDMIYGKGLNANDASTKPNEYAQMISLFKKSEIKRLVADLKLLGNGALQIIYNRNHTKIVEVYHVPVQYLRAEKADEESVVNGYYYSTHWDKIYGKNKPQRVPAFGTSNEPLEILYFQNYKPGSTYYTPPDYQPGLAYAELEEEIASYHINNIKNGFAPSTLINFNNGQASTNEQKQAIEASINKKFSGTAGNKIVLSFNDNAESETSIETIQLSDAHNQYQFLSDEASKKIMVAHRVTSPMLFGISTSNGFNSNTDELKTSSIFMYETVINPFQETLIDGFDKILSFNEIALDLFFVPNQPWKVIAEESTNITPE